MFINIIYLNPFFNSCGLFFNFADQKSIYFSTFQFINTLFHTIQMNINFLIIKRHRLIFSQFTPSIWYSWYNATIFHLINNNTESTFKLCFSHDPTINATNVTYMLDIFLAPFSVENWVSTNYNICIKPQWFFKNVPNIFWFNTVKLEPIFQKLLIKRTFTTIKSPLSLLRNTSVNGIGRFIWKSAKTAQLLDILLSRFHPSPPSPATQQASRAHDKRDLYNTCIVSQLSRNKYCLNQSSLTL